MPLRNLPRPLEVALLIVPLFVSLVWPITSAHAQGSVTYEYDGLGRVTKATYSNGTMVTYSYDAADNRITTTTTP
jgi:YD repeat-containing protein